MTQSLASNADWLKLQKKIFGRWIQQKIAKRDIKVNDIVADFKDGHLLIVLIEELSEHKYTDKFDKTPKMRAQLLDNATNALKFAFSQGLDMKIKPSAEDLVDGDEKNVLALVWAIMLKFIKIDDDDSEGQALNPKDALLMWVKNKVHGYAGVSIDSFKKSFSDGLALCALIHKHRPKLLNYEALNHEDKLANLGIALDAANKYFGLDRYLEPEDIPKLDENSMVIFVSEFYYGIAEQRKLDIAARRIGKLIKFTKENDAKKAEYTQKAQGLVDRIKKVEVVLEDRTIDNTMAGAQKRIEDFYGYKSNDKNVIIGDQLNLEGIYNNLSMRLNNHKRPEFVPTEGASLKDLEKAIKHLEECEQERNVALHAELNRQIKLVKLDGVHKMRFEKIKAWVAEKEAYLKTREEVTSVSGAQLQLRLLDAYDKEKVSVTGGPAADLKKLGGELANEKYENIGDISSREAEVDSLFANLDQLSAAKRPVLDDNLAREQFKEKVRLMNLQHIGKHDKLQSWIAEAEGYLNKKESINSVSEAQTQLGLLDVYESDKVNASETSVAHLKKLGETILAQKYETQYSSYVFGTPEEIQTRESAIDAKWASLSELSAAKKQTLEADLAREIEKERLRLEFAHQAADFVRWSKDVAEGASLSQFGFTLAEVEAFKAVLDAENASVAAEADKRKAEYEAVYKQGQDLGVNENIYTSHDPSSLTGSRGNLDAALDARNKAYEAELALQQANDALCKQFADLVEPLSKWVSEQKDIITNSKASLEEQLSNVEAKVASVESDGAKIPEIKSLSETIKSKAITNNRHTNLTALDVEVQWEQWKAFLDKKKTMLVEEIEHQKLRGISAEEFKEIEENFKQFDYDKSNNIDKKELKACLYSLGQEKSKSEIEAIMKEYGNETGKISYARFRDFMILVYGDSDTKDEIIHGFKLINKGAEVAKADLSELVITENDWKYITETAPPASDGYDYTTWTEAVFAR